MKLPLEVNYSREYWGNEFVFEWTDGHDLTFLGSRFMLFCRAHCEMQSMSFCRDDTSPTLETSDIVTSSTYFQWLERRGEWVARSLIIIRERIGPNLMPWRTPACTGIHSEMESKSLTAWQRPLRKLQIQLINQPLHLDGLAWSPRWYGQCNQMLCFESIHGGTCQGSQGMTANCAACPIGSRL